MERLTKQQALDIEYKNLKEAYLRLQQNKGNEGLQRSYWWHMLIIKRNIDSIKKRWK